MSNTAAWIVVILLVVFLVWGIIGGMAAQDPGITCDMGFGPFCWQWHKNIAGQIGEFIHDISHSIGG